MYVYRHTHKHMYNIYHIFIFLSVDGQLDCCHILAIVNSSSMNIDMHVSFQLCVFVFFR